MVNFWHGLRYHGLSNHAICCLVGIVVEPTAHRTGEQRFTFQVDQMLSNSLTMLELRCLTMVAGGKPAAGIRSHVGMTDREVDIALFCAQRKLGAVNRMHAVAMGISRGLIAI